MNKIQLNPESAKNLQASQVTVYDQWDEQQSLRIFILNFDGKVIETSDCRQGDKPSEQFFKDSLAKLVKLHPELTETGQAILVQTKARELSLTPLPTVEFTNPISDKTEMIRLRTESSAIKKAGTLLKAGWKDVKAFDKDGNDLNVKASAKGK